MNLKKLIAIGLIVTAAFVSFGCGDSGEKTGVADKQPEQQQTQLKQTEKQQDTQQEKQQEKQQETQEVAVKNELSNLVLDVPRFEMFGGKASLMVTITNNNKEGVTIKEGIIEAEFDDPNGQLIWKGWSYFDGINLYIPAGEQRRHTFHIIDSNCPNYEGKAMIHTRYVFGK
ncbi:hypothetical protein SAMN02745671_01412 [Anaerovibrio lipolyticus DSM 3074]|uniref:Uncharacterized protein n=1 Tax=Anaerovibrio lipolyticus DSM 3074 TaxID=1120997 RepID=A0A1M6DB33_9FIRM|nr:hypothetical protein [Anaerovibrio lipolyticus]SHI70311.1 hypothetical protein SAMN02745671_01412 [Anaerovibrio lipolyticus DSM 3074]